MQQNAAFHQGLHCLLSKKYLQTKEYDIFKHNNLAPIDMHNGLFQGYCIKAEGEHTKGHKIIYGKTLPVSLL